MKKPKKKRSNIDKPALLLPASFVVRSSSLSLSKSIKSRKIVYLDMMYWINFRKSVYENTPVDKYDRVLELLLALKRRKVIVCPANIHIACEIMKQPDIRMQRHTARLIDDLSCGVSFHNPNAIRLIETLSYVCERLRIRTDGQQARDLVFTKMAWMSGLRLPGKELHDENPEKHEVQISHFQFESARESLESSVVSISHLATQAEQMYDNELCADATEKSKKMPASVKYEDILVSHIKSCLRSRSEIGWLAVDHVMQTDPFRSLWGGSESSRRKMYYNYIVELLSDVPAAERVPSLFIPCALFAIKLFGKQSFHAGDVYDANHASIALPYCDYFFTERKLAAAISGNIGSLQLKYPCKVVGKVDEAIKILEALNVGV
ncbi:MAG: hypothetical protein U0640_12225 [Phycisphaerales bacterium]